MLCGVDRSSTRILIFGGTFDPPHLAHATLPPRVASTLGCERILYIPAAINPLKDDRPTPAEHRLAMLRLALAGLPQAEIRTIELDREGPSYTIDTVETLRDAFAPDVELHLLIGADQALDFRRWKDWQRILTLATPAVMLRPPLDRAAFRARLEDDFEPDEAARWLTWTAETPLMHISATEIRTRLAAGGDLTGLLDPSVINYIGEHALYRESGS